jgi:CBS domain-containing protein
MISQPDEDPFQVLARGETPALSSLRMHNGTVWRWNRACYGVADGVAHLRIENRALPAGPTVIDEVANAAFFAGLMLALPQEYGDVAKRMRFDDAKSNFFRAARHGLDAQFNWIDGKRTEASSLVLEQLLPLARQGLDHAGIDSAETNKYLGVIEERVRSRRTGARWILKSLRAMHDVGSKDVQQQRLAAAMLACQKKGEPVHLWPLIAGSEPNDWEQGHRTVGQFMSTDLFTVQPDDLIDLAASVMDWRHIRHVPVEDEAGRLVGLVTHRGLLHLLISRIGEKGLGVITVREVMVRDPLTVSPSTPTLTAIEMMRQRRIGCLPVVEGDQLVGIVTSFDFLDASARLFKEHLEETPKSNQPLAMGQAAG